MQLSVLTSMPKIAEREERLASILRYDLYHTMYYRSSVLDHSIRVWAIVRELLPCARKTFGNSFDAGKAAVLALTHDDTEIIIGDIQAGNKSKMSPVQIKEIYKREQNAITELIKKFPKSINGYSYEDLLNSAQKNKCLEAQLVQYADKLDAFGEALHEIFAGNTVFAINVKNQYGIISTPVEYYISYFKNYLSKYPQMKQLFDANFPLRLVPKEIDYIAISQKTKPHSKESIYLTSGYAHYDFWKKVVLKNKHTIPSKYLYTQVESSK